MTAQGQTPSDQPQVSAWATGGASATARPGDADGKPAAAAPLPYWQATAMPQAVIQGGAIPAGWQPQAVPYHGVGPDGKPITVYLAPTYVFTYQSGPPVLAIPGGSRGVTRTVPGATASGWNYATSGAPPVAPATTVARYPPTPYQFPADSRALSGTPVVPPGNPPAAPQQGWTASTESPAATAAAPPAPPPTPAPPPAPPPTPSSGDWVTVVPPATASAVLAAGASGAASQPAAQAAAAPAMVSAPSTGATPAQPASTGGSGTPLTAVAAPHLWRVVGVQDGDTLTCLDEANQQQRVRLAGVDAPEIGQAYGKEAREALAGLVFGKTIEVYDQGRDDAGRWLARVVVDGSDVGPRMVASGAAWYDASTSGDQTLAALQGQAQSQSLGLWAAASPTPPWTYRQSAGGS